MILPTERTKPSDLPIPSRRWQVGLGTLMYGMLLLGLGLGWYRDHQQLEAEESQVPIDLSLCEEQIVDMSQRFEQSIFLIGPFPLRPTKTSTGREYFPWDATQYIEMLHALPDDRYILQGIPLQNQFATFASMITRAPDDVHDDALVGMLPFFQAEDVNTRLGMAVAMKNEFSDRRNRIEPHRERVVRELIKLLHDPAEDVRLEALYAIEKANFQALAAVGSLRTMATTEDDPLAIHAVVAMTRIDSSPATIKQMKRLIEQRYKNWYYGVRHFAEFVPQEEAIEFFRQQLDQATKPAERQEFIRAINDLAIAGFQSNSSEP